MKLGCAGLIFGVPASMLSICIIFKFSTLTNFLESCFLAVLDLSGPSQEGPTLTQNGLSPSSTSLPPPSPSLLYLLPFPVCHESSYLIILLPLFFFRISHLTLLCPPIFSFISEPFHLPCDLVYYTTLLTAPSHSLLFFSRWRTAYVRARSDHNVRGGYTVDFFYFLPTYYNEMYQRWYLHSDVLFICMVCNKVHVLM